MKFIFLSLTLLLVGCSHLPTKPVDYSQSEGVDAVKQVIDYYTYDVRNCYEAALVDRPALEARIVYAFKVDSAGVPHDVAVKEAKGCTVDDALAICIKNKFVTWKFPPASTAETIGGSYPFVLRRTGSSFPN